MTAAFHPWIFMYLGSTCWVNMHSMECGQWPIMILEMKNEINNDWTLGNRIMKKFARIILGIKSLSQASHSRVICSITKNLKVYLVWKVEYTENDILFVSGQTRWGDLVFNPMHAFETMTKVDNCKGWDILMLQINLHVENKTFSRTSHPLPWEVNSPPPLLNTPTSVESTRVFSTKPQPYKFVDKLLQSNNLYWKLS